MSTNIRMTKTCEFCKNEFEAKTITTRYCSHAFNNRAYKQIQREAKIYTAIPGMPEKEIGEGKGCTIETVNDKNIYAWAENG